MTEERDELRAEVERLKARGIEDMQHEIKELRAELDRIVPVMKAARRKMRFVDESGEDVIEEFLAKREERS